MTLRILIAALAVLVAAQSPAGLQPAIPAAHAQTGPDRPEFIPLGRIPRLLQPGGEDQPRFRRGGQQIRFFVDQNSLAQNISPNLSNACALGRFNQQHPTRYFVLIETQDGRRLRLGFATSEGFNLRDPDNRRGRDLAFLFEKDRTSECRVYAVATFF